MTVRSLVLLMSCALLAASCSAASGSDGVAATAPVLSSLPPSRPQTTTTNPPPASAAPDTSTGPATTEAVTTTLQPERGRLVISATGDVNLDPDYIPELGAEGYAYAWSGLQGMFERDDLTIVNLECPVSDLGSPEPKEFAFRCDPAALEPMRAAGVEVANLGNNHSGDYGKEALLDSRARIESAGMAAVGAGADFAEAHEPAVFEIHGWTVAVLGFGGVFPTEEWFATEDRPGMADGDTIETMVAAVRAAGEVADLVLVTIHWGVELDTRPRPEDRERAEAMIAAGADAIFGHHAHRLQPLEIVSGVPVAWGLGNFVWPTLSDAGRRTAVAQVIIEPDGFVEACLVPAYLEQPGRPELEIQYDSDDPCAEG